MQRLNAEPLLQGAPNFRDIGGHTTRGGGQVRCGQVYRSDRLTALAPRDLHVIRRLGIRTLCDLRSESERRLHPNQWPEDHPVHQISLNILTDVRAARSSLFEHLRSDPTKAGAAHMMRLLYQGMPAAFAPHMATLFGQIGEGRMPLLIHCTAGKDRTGFAVATLLSILGVDERDIYGDYLLTARFTQRDERVLYLTELLQLQLGHPPAIGAVDAIMGVDESYLAAAFGEIQERFGSVEGYLTGPCGITSGLLEAVRQRLVR
jgi:protein-tyrosine phosphatase